MSQHLFYGLTGEGFDVVCMEARQVNAAWSAMRNKTDRNDARGIAQVSRTGWFSPVHMKSREAHGVRALLSTCNWFKFPFQNHTDTPIETTGIGSQWRRVAEQFGGKTTAA